MKITTVSYSLSEQPATLEEWETALVNEVNNFIKSGSDIILYPELFLMGLSDYFPSAPLDQYLKISEYVHNKLLTTLKSVLSDTQVLVVLGSGPRKVNDVIYNSSPIWMDGQWMYQDKIHLTPWEVDFIPGNSINILKFKDLKIVSLICFDVEMPGIALKLKKEGVHIVLVPSATASKNGNQRINRCASARSVELGAAVVTVPLVGNSHCDLVDHNEGRQGCFLPPQELIQQDQEVFSEYSVSKKVIVHYEMDIDQLKKLKEKSSETKPFLTEDAIGP